jgi:hypothetical protein
VTGTRLPGAPTLLFKSTSSDQGAQNMLALRVNYIRGTIVTTLKGVPIGRNTN